MSPAFEYERDRYLWHVDFSEHAWDGVVTGERTFDFYGAAEHQFKLDDTVWEAVEDPDDGYRSHLGFMAIVQEADRSIFFQTPIARVRVVHFVGSYDTDYGSKRDCDFFHLTDADDGHIWLTVGTDNTDDYYPCFTFHYEPKEAPNEQR
jgi:hypothetical protein